MKKSPSTGDGAVETNPQPVYDPESSKAPAAPMNPAQYSSFKNQSLVNVSGGGGGMYAPLMAPVGYGPPPMPAQMNVYGGSAGSSSTLAQGPGSLPLYGTQYSTQFMGPQPGYGAMNTMIDNNTVLQPQQMNPPYYPPQNRPK